MTAHKAVAATCTEAGNNAYWSCDKCNKFFGDSEGKTEVEENSWVIDAKGHTVVIDAAKEPSCTETGLTEGRHCSVCNEILVAQEEVPAKGHEWDEGVVTTEPSCTTKGVKTFTCSDCEETRTEEVAALGHNLTAHKAVEASCTEAGNNAYWSCGRCGKFFSDENGETEAEENSWVIAAFGHDLSKGTVTKAPTTEEEGVMTYTCTHTGCGESISKPIPKLENEQAEASEAVDNANEAASQAEQAADGITDSSSDEEITEADTVAETAVSEAEEAYEKAVEAYEKAEEGSTAAEYAQTMLDEAKKLKAKALVASAGVKTSSAKSAGYAAAKAKAKASEAAATPGDAAVTAAQKAETLAKETAKKAGIAAETAKAAFDAVKDAGYAPDSKQYQDAEEALEAANALKKDADKSAKEAANAVEEAKKAKEKAEKPAKTDNPSEQMGKDGTAVGPGASLEVAEKAITGRMSDADPQGSVYSILRLRSPKQTSTSIKLSWLKNSKAVKYVIYGNRCGKTNKLIKLTEVSNKNISNLTFKQVAGKKLRKGTYYKFIIVAIDKNNKVVSTSKIIHVATKGGKVGNYKSVTVSKSVINKAKKLKAGKSLKLKAKAVRQSGKLKVKKHRGLEYVSSNKNVATVTKKGVIKAISKGTCDVYVYAQNGVYKKIKVVVK